MTSPTPFGVLPPSKPFPKWAYWLIGGTVLLGLLCVGGILVAVNASKPASTSAAAADVSIPGCAPTGQGMPRALLKVQNSTTRNRDYQITVAFESGNEQLDTALAVVNDLGPGQVTYPDAVGFSAPRNQPYTCRIVKVNRY